MAEPKAKKAASKKINDVVPGGDAASGNSRQIIVNNRPIMQDPMMAQVSELANARVGIAAEEPQTEEVSAAKPKRTTIKIKPLEDAAAAETPPEPEVAPKAETPASADEPAEEPAEQEAAAAASDKAAPTEPTEQPDEPTTAASDPAAAAPVTDTVEADKVSEDERPTAEDDSTSDALSPDEPAQPGRSSFAVPAKNDTAEEDANKKAADSSGGKLTSEQQKAVESGKYFLPIRTAESRRVRREIALAFVAVILLSLVWLDVALDAGLIQLGGLQAVTHFF